MSTFDIEYKVSGDELVHSELFDSNSRTTEDVIREFKEAHPEVTEVIQVVECAERDEDDIVDADYDDNTTYWRLTLQQE